MDTIFTFLLGFLGSMFVSILYHTEKKLFLFCGLSGLVGWIIFYTINSRTSRVILATFLGAIAVALYSEIMARIKKTPATIFLITGIFPIVPGVGAYNTIISIVNNNLSEAAVNGFITSACAGALAFGIITVSSLFRLINTSNKKNLT